MNDSRFKILAILLEWSSGVLRPCKHNTGYMGDGYYRSKDPNNSIKVLKEKATKEKTRKRKQQNTHIRTQ